MSKENNFLTENIYSLNTNVKFSEDRQPSYGGQSENCRIVVLNSCQFSEERRHKSSLARCYWWPNIFDNYRRYFRSQMAPSESSVYRSGQMLNVLALKMTPVQGLAFIQSQRNGFRSQAFQHEYYFYIYYYQIYQLLI